MPVGVVDEEHVLFFIENQDAMKYWSFLPNREDVFFVELVPDISSGGWILPRLSTNLHQKEDNCCEKE